MSWLELFAGELYYWTLLASFLPAVLLLARRFPLRRATAFPAVVRHSAAAIAVGAIHSALYYTPLLLLTGVPQPRVPEALGQRLPTALMTVFWKYWVVLGVYYAFDYHRKFQERRRRAWELEASLSRARLEALRAQIHPHFLFNTLNTVSILNREDPAAANRVLARLSALLRTALDTRDVQEVPLADELEFVGGYLEIEKVRFEDRLRVIVDVPTELLGARVPNLLLQPLVENAVEHGVKAAAEHPGTVALTARRRGRWLEIRICDSGPGLRTDDEGVSGLPGSDGLGLSNVRARLEALYGSRGGLRLEPSPTGGLCAVVTIPHHTRPIERSLEDPR